ncbi:hypothetical protein Pcinc_041110 [Petrolisthes cinctipes]|uniref:Uncharacterized protein n=1 Tax=Petrolisthes cinctipes TaxID=88211 RepID=A0AAE1BK82_PETCI|nr:hypothetical protein Pcinc_041110 [Petrolisthes cinctipes]
MGSMVSGGYGGRGSKQEHTHTTTLPHHVTPSPDTIHLGYHKYPSLDSLQSRLQDYFVGPIRRTRHVNQTTHMQDSLAGHVTETKQPTGLIRRTNSQGHIMEPTLTGWIFS